MTRMEYIQTCIDIWWEAKNTYPRKPLPYSETDRTNRRTREAFESLYNKGITLPEIREGSHDKDNEQDHHGLGQGTETDRKERFE